jgi:hypothetical protein
MPLGDLQAMNEVHEAASPAFFDRLLLPLHGDQVFHIIAFTHHNLSMATALIDQPRSWKSPQSILSFNILPPSMYHQHALLPQAWLGGNWVPYFYWMDILVEASAFVEDTLCAIQGANWHEEEVLKKSATCALGIAILSGLCQSPKLAASHHMTSKVPIFIKVRILHRAVSGNIVGSTSREGACKST